MQNTVLFKESARSNQLRKVKPSGSAQSHKMLTAQDLPDLSASISGKIMADLANLTKSPTLSSKGSQSKKNPLE